MSLLTTKHHPNEILDSIIGSLRGVSVTKAMVSDQTHKETQEPSFNSLIAKLEKTEQTQVKNVFLTLHFLFPHELLPALDLLDRRLVTSLWSPVSRSEGDVAWSTTEPNLDTDHRNQHQDDRSNEKQSTISKHYYVQSASTTTQAPSTSSSTGSTSRYRNVYNTAETYYEVHLDSWNCTCPAFAFSSMKLLMSRGDESGGQTLIEKKQNFSTLSRRGNHEDTNANSNMVDNHEGDGKQGWRFGGTATQADSMVPICKHVLAVVLAHGAPNLFGNAALSVQASGEEVGGRAAGYGTG